MPTYIYGGYVYFNKNIDIPNDHHINFVLNQKTDFYIISPSILMIEKLHTCLSYLLMKL